MHQAETPEVNETPLSPTHSCPTALKDRKSAPARPIPVSDARAAKLEKRAKWPPEVRDKIKSVSLIRRTITGHYRGQVEIRSRRDHGFYAMWLSGAHKGLVARGNSGPQAIGNLIRLMDPEVEEIRYQ